MGRRNIYIPRGSCATRVGSPAKSKRDPVYNSHSKWFKYGSLHDATFTDRQQSIIAGEFDIKDVRKPEVEFILDKLEYLEMNDLFFEVYERYEELFHPKAKHKRRDLTPQEEIDTWFADIEARARGKK